MTSDGAVNDKIVQSGIDSRDLQSNDSDTIEFSFNDGSLHDFSSMNKCFTMESTNNTLTYVSAPGVIYTLVHIYSSKPGIFKNSISTSIDGEYILIFQSNKDDTNAKYIYVVIPLINNINATTDVTNCLLRNIFPTDDKRYLVWSGVNMEYALGKFVVINFLKPVEIKFGYVDTFVELYSNSINKTPNNQKNFFALYSGKKLKIDATPARTQQFKCVDIDVKKDIEGDYVLVDPKTGKRLDKILRDANADDKAAIGGGGVGFLMKIITIIAYIVIVVLGVLIMYFIYRVASDANFRGSLKGSDGFGFMTYVIIFVGIIVALSLTT